MDSKELAEIAIKKGALQKVTELSSLINFLKKRKLNTIVEIGTARGGTLYTWCQIAESAATIVGVDLPQWYLGGSFLNNIKKFSKYKKESQKLYFIKKDSHRQSTKEELIEILDGRKIDFLFIDGDHTYEGIKRDWLLYSSLVKNKGLIAFHDILYHPLVSSCKVDKFWNEIKVNYDHLEFTDKGNLSFWGQWGGIGLIYYNGYNKNIACEREP